MEDVLEVYHRPYDPRFPNLCMDEASKQLIKEKREPLSLERGNVKKVDYEYEPDGMCNIFVAVEPAAGRRILKVTEQRTKKEWAYFMREVIDGHYPQAEKVILVMDNLNTHVFSSFYEAFCPEEARRLVEKIEIHHTPKHGSWLNMAEIELSVLARQCLPERIDSKQKVEEHVRFWQEQRNQDETRINWRFTTENARIKLKHLYPTVK